MSVIRPRNSKKDAKRNIWSIAFFILFGISLYVLTNKAVVPFVEHVANSDFFLEEDSGAEVKDRTDIAILRCNDLIREHLDGARVEFDNNEPKSWELSRDRYLVASSVLIYEDDGVQTKKNYACNIHYTGGDEMDKNSWNLEGLDIKDI